VEFVLHPLIHTRLDLNLAQNAVGGQINAVEKESPHQPVAKPMGATTRPWVNPILTLRVMRCKPDAKKKPPLTEPVKASGGKKKGR